MTAFVSFAGNPTHQMPIVLDPDEAFAARCRSFVASAFGRFEFFGVDPLGVPRRHTFDRGYFAPTLVPDEPASGDPATAGERVLDEENINLMLERADRPHWHDVVVTAGAQARPKERAGVLRELVERADRDAANRETFVLLATAIMEQAPVLPTDQPEVRGLVDNAVCGLIPPQSADAADRLADVGPLVLELLPDADPLGEDEHLLVVRTLAGIAAGPKAANAVERIQRTLKGAPRGLAKRMVGELFNTWGRRGDYESYARDVLSELSFAKYPVSLQNPRRIEHVDLLSTITNLTVREYSGGLAPVATLASLRRLRLVRHNQVRLDGLERAPALHTLDLHGCSTLFGTRGIDLAPLARTTVRRLKISGFPTKISLAGLAGLRLQSPWLGGDALRGAVALLAGRQVRHLTLLAPTRGRVDFTAMRGVRSLILSHTPAQHELDALPELQRLIVVAAGR